MPRSHDVDSMSIGDWIAALRPSQMWSILTLLVALAGGSFTLGYKFRSASAEAGAFQTQKNAESLAELEEKDRFLSLYLRFLIAATDKTGIPDNAASPQIAQTADSLKSYIQRLVIEGDSSGVETKGLRLGKPARNDTTARYEGTVKFKFDDTIWPVPQRFGIAAAAR